MIRDRPQRQALVEPTLDGPAQMGEKQHARTLCQRQPDRLGRISPQ